MRSRAKPRDLLKFGQLFLQRAAGPGSGASSRKAGWTKSLGHGLRGGTRSARKRWVTYGMLWWVTDAEPRVFFAWGYGGQFVYVVPSRSLVVATTEWRDLAETLPRALEEEVLDVIVRGVLAAAS